MRARRTRIDYTESYVDGAPKTSLGRVRLAAGSVHRGIAATCPGLRLTLKVVISAAMLDRRGVTSR